MKQNTFLFFLLIATFTHAQVAPPQAFSYSAVARDGLGNPLVNQTVGLQFSILKSSTVGPVQYKENQFTTTNQFGLFTLTIGTGSVLQGNFSAINWGNDSYYLKVGLDATGGTNFQTMGTTQLLSVPYALYAGSAGNASNIDDHDTSATNEIQTLGLNGHTLTITQGNQVTLPTVFDHDTSSSNEFQNLSFANDTISISNGNKVALPYNSQTNFTVKINGVSISDPSINHVMVGPDKYLTATNYKYILTDPFLGDTVYLTSGTTYYANNSCSGTIYVSADDLSVTLKGKVFSLNGNFQSVYYVPISANAVTLTNTYTFDTISSCVGPDPDPRKFYVAVPNNPAVTGYSFPSGKLTISFER